MLHLQLLVPLAAAPGIDGLNSPSQSRPPGLARQTPTAASGATPVQREPQEVEGVRTLPTLLSLRRSPKVQQAGLVWMEGQSLALHPLRQHRQDALGILPIREADDQVIGIPDEAGPAP